MPNKKKFSFSLRSNTFSSSKTRTPKTHITTKTICCQHNTQGYTTLKCLVSFQNSALDIHITINNQNIAYAAYLFPNPIYFCNGIFATNIPDPIGQNTYLNHKSHNIWLFLPFV